MKISKTILAVFQLTNEMSAKAAHKFVTIVGYIFLRDVVNMLFCLMDPLNSNLALVDP